MNILVLYLVNAEGQWFREFIVRCSTGQRFLGLSR
jgi:hypothetical protein